MSDIAVSVQGLSKRYRIGAPATQSSGMRESLRRSITGPFSYLSASLREPTDEETLWAVRDVNFDVPKGQVVGIIGRNGAGKSTLLKLLSRITEPTGGRAVIEGRLGSLLEVGAGFHPELTGRENIFLNGAILGMHRTEVRAKFDDIVGFSGVERFLDTPVKRYSSGMYVRLAFAVAAHLEPEVLIVDEVLAVGDAEFQRRCLGKMEAIGQEGRTVLLVSHSMPTISRFCKRAILLHGGTVAADGPVNDVVATYLQSGHGIGSSVTWDEATAPGSGSARLRAIRAIDADHITQDAFDIRRPIGIEVTYDVLEPLTFVPWIQLESDLGGPIFSAFDTDPDWRQPRAPGTYTSTAWIPGDLLNEGTVVVTISLHTFAAGGKAEIHAMGRQAIAFQVLDAGDGTTSRGDAVGTWIAPVRPLLKWDLERDQA